MSGNLVFNTGAVLFIVAMCLMWWGNHLKSNQQTETIITEIRKTSTEKTQPNQVAIFQQINNKVVFQEAKPEQNPSTPSANPKKEAKIILSLPSLEIDDGHNISGIVDHGSGDIAIVFDEDFPNKNYYVNITGDQTINYRQIIKAKGSVRIKFEEENLTMVQIVCTES